MKQIYLSAAAILLSVGLHAQTPVPVGSGSYASAPPESEYIDWNNDGTFELEYFLYDKPIYVADNETRPIPTNDWWTDLLVEQYSGLLWAYPLMIDAENYGAKVYFPNSFVADGSNIAYGGGMMIKAEGYNPTKAIAKDWSDWGVVMGMPDENNGKNMDVTMAHGIPYTWFETQGINPKFSYDNGATYLNADGTSASFPLTGSFVIQTDGRYFGVHMADNITATIQGQQYAIIDLGTVQPITNISLNWETAFGSAYGILVSNNGTDWATAFNETNGDGGIDNISVSASGRYVKIAFYEQGTQWPYSLWEMQVYNGSTLLSQGQPVEVSSVQGPFAAANLNDGNTGTRWAADNVETGLVLDTNNSNSYFVISALPSPQDLTAYDAYAFNKVTDTDVTYSYDAQQGEVTSDWNITTTNLKGLPAGNTIQGFLPHLYDNAEHNVNFTANNYVSPRGTLKTAIGNSFSFTYKFTGILPNYNAPFSNSDDANPYDANTMFNLVTKYSSKQTYGGDTYWGGKDLVNFAKYTLMAKELGHQAYPAMRQKTHDALANWLTYTVGEEEKYFAHYERWGAIVGFNESYGSSEFTDNHFHYGYLIEACAMYAMVDPDFLTEYGDMVKLVARQYANWIKDDEMLPYLRTFDPWIGHSYAGGTSSVTGNNQESTSEAMQSWTGLFLLGDMLQDQDILDAAAFGYMSESYAALEYWFDWKQQNLPAAYAHNMVGILSNQGFAYGTFFSASPIHIHGIQYLPVNPGFRYLARDPQWAASEYSDMMAEVNTVEGFTTETQFGDDWAHVALGFRLLWDPEYVSAYMDNNLQLAEDNPSYIMDYEVAGMTYYYTHANQNLGDFSDDYYTDFPTSSVFTENGVFSHAVAYNPTSAEKTCTIYDMSGNATGTFQVPAYTMVTYPELPTTGQEPEGCYGLVPATATATSGDATLAIDGNGGSRWESAFEDPQSITVDMGEVSTINTVTIKWEAANAKNYTFSGSVDGEEWTQIGAYTDMAEGNRVDVIDNIDTDYRYLKVDGTARNLTYGYSIFEFEVCGTSIGQTTGVTQINKNDVNLYPNPAHDFVNVTADADGQLRIYDINGSLILSQDVKAGKNTIPTNKIATGLYLVKIGDKVSRLLVK